MTDRSDGDDGDWPGGDPEQPDPSSARERLDPGGTARKVAPMPSSRTRYFRAEELRDINKLRRRWGNVLLGALVLQIVFVHVVFILHLANNDWRAEGNVFIAYLLTTLGETVGIATIIVRHLFPSRDQIDG